MCQGTPATITQSQKMGKKKRARQSDINDTPGHSVRLSAARSSRSRLRPLISLSDAQVRGPPVATTSGRLSGTVVNDEWQTTRESWAAVAHLFERWRQKRCVPPLDPRTHIHSSCLLTHAHLSPSVGSGCLSTTTVLAPITCARSALKTCTTSGRISSFGCVCEGAFLSLSHHVQTIAQIDRCPR